jgi:hypothetical protein
MACKAKNSYLFPERMHWSLASVIRGHYKDFGFSLKNNDNPLGDTEQDSDMI